jgi:hypothetical protein
MPQLISIASQAPTVFDTLIASPFDLGNIEDAFMYYHYGVSKKGEEPSSISINGHLKQIKNNLFSASASSIDVLETYNFALNSSGSLKNINDLNVFEKLENIKKEIYASFNTKSSSYTLQISDNKKIIVVQSEILTNVVIPNDSQENFPLGSNLEIINIGENSVNIIGNSGVSLRGEKKTLEKSIFKANQSKAIYKRASNDWVIIQ